METWESSFAGSKFDCGLRKQSRIATVSIVVIAEGKKLQEKKILNGAVLLNWIRRYVGASSVDYYEQPTVTNGTRYRFVKVSRKNK